jgi:type II secretory pathway pseudopilin PulG
MRSGGERRKGLTLVEILLALGVFTVAILGLVGGIVTAMRTQSSAREQAVALNAARKVMEEIRNSGAFSGVFAAYRGRAFTQSDLETWGLRLQGGKASVLFPVEAATPTELHETTDMSAWGASGGMDLNGDGKIVAGDRSSDYALLPVMIRVEWRQGPQDAKLDFSAVLYGQTWK